MARSELLDRRRTGNLVLEGYHTVGQRIGVRPELARGEHECHHQRHPGVVVTNLVDSTPQRGDSA